MPSAQQQAWAAACERGHVYIVPGGATKWRRGRDWRARPGFGGRVPEQHAGLGPPPRQGEHCHPPDVNT